MCNTVTDSSVKTMKTITDFNEGESKAGVKKLQMGERQIWHETTQNFYFCCVDMDDWRNRN